MLKSGGILRRKVPWRMASKENYIKFCQENPNLKLSFMEWGNIVYTFNYGMRDYALETGEVIKLPWGFGEIVVSKKKRQKFIVDPLGREFINLPIDWPKTLKAGKRVYNLNHHTDGFSFKWKWFRFTGRFRFHKLWNFKPSRVSSRLLAHYIFKGYGKKYREWYKIKR